MSVLSVFYQLRHPYILVDQQQKLLLVNPAAESLLAETQATLADSLLWQNTLIPLLQCTSESDDSHFYHNGLTYQLTVSDLSLEDQRIQAIQIQEAQTTREQLHNLYSLLDNLGAYVYCKDRSYRYNFVNRQVCDLFNLPPEQIIGQEDSIFFDETTCLQLRKNDRLVIEQGEVIEKEESNYVPHLKTFRHYLTVKKPILNEHHQVSGLLGISTDITELKQIQQKLYNSEQHLSTILDNVGAYIFIKDQDCRFLYINKKTEELMGLSCQQVTGLSNSDLFGAETGRQFEKTDRQVFEQEKRISCVETMNHDGSLRYYWTVKVPLKNKAGQVDRYIGMSTDITEQKELEYRIRASNQVLQDKISEISQLKDELHIQATHDALTGLYNRRFLQEHADLAFPEKPRAPASLLVIDVDHFKKINDSLGHSKGDEILQLLARVMRQCCRSNDVVCRYGGEEFLILLPGAEPDIALQKAELIRTQFQQAVRQQIPDIPYDSISAGVAGSPVHGITFTEIYQAADLALYQAKDTGRNRACLARVKDPQPSP